MKRIKSNVKSEHNLLYCPCCKCKPKLNYKKDSGNDNPHWVDITCPKCYSFMVFVRSMSKPDAISKATFFWRMYCLKNG